MSEQKKIILGYWNAYGTAQPARYLLEITGTPYEDFRYVNDDDWFVRDKFSLGLPFPNLPYLIDNETKMTEFVSIFDYLIDKYGKPEWHGKGEDKYTVKTLRSMIQGMVDAIYFVDFKPEIEKEAYFEKQVALKFKFLHEFIGESKQFLLGEFTGADLFFLNLIRYFKSTNNFSEKIAPYLDRLNRIQANIEAIPQIQEYINSGRHVKGNEMKV